jgi:cytochrome c nitrite reductase small subunit
MQKKFSVTLLLAVVAGALIGLGGYTFVYARGYSYLSNDPKACTNCHVMNAQYDGWVKGSHKFAATCNDCHTPHNLAGKYTIKARNGFFHSLYFTTGLFPDNIQIAGTSRNVTENACRRCHGEISQAIDTGQHGDGREVSCLRCHNSVGHSESTAALRPSTREGIHER